MAATDVISLDAAMAHLNMTDSTDSAELAGHITAASQMVEHHVGPVIVREFTDVERWGPRFGLDHRPVVELVSVTPTFGGDAVDVTGLRVHPVTGVVRLLSGARLSGGPYDVTYRAGRAVTVNEVPESIGQACREIVRQLWETQRAVTLGPGLAADEFGATPAGPRLPYRARDLLAPYRQMVVA